MAEKTHKRVAKLRVATIRIPKSRLLATTALAGILVAPASQALADPDSCLAVGSTVTCTGNQSQGIASGDDFLSSATILNVNNLNSHITPAVDTNGILFDGDTTVEINSSLGQAYIAITGEADGVLGTAPGAVTINHQGRIFGAFRGINAHSTGDDVEIDAEGLIYNTTEAAINAYAPAGGIIIDYAGNIREAHNRGISAIALDDIEIDHEGQILSVNQAIFAQSSGGSIDIDSSGYIGTSSGDAIDAEASGMVTIRRVGDTIAEDRAIFAYAGDDASVESYGNVTSRDIDAINVQSQSGMASIYSRGNIQAGNQGLFAKGSTGASIDSRGNVKTGDADQGGNDGIFAFVSGAGDATVTSVGNVDAGVRGVLAISSGGMASVYSEGRVRAKVQGVYAQGSTGASVEQYGDVTSTDSSGIVANVSSNGDAEVISRGKVQAQTEGVGATVQGNGNATVDHVGDVNVEYGSGIKSFVGGNGDASVMSSGKVVSNTEGVAAIVNGTGSASITHRGDVTSLAGRGVTAEAGGDITIDVVGKINSNNQGVYARSDADNSAVSIISRGNITTNAGVGIYAEASPFGTGGTVDIDSVGNIFAGGGNMGIQALASGDVTVTSKGDVDTFNNGNFGNNAIDAQSFGGSSSVVSVGNINAANQGIFAKGSTGASIDSMGNVFAHDNDGIFAYATSTGDATVKSRGDIDAQGRDVPETGGRGVMALANTGNASIDSEGTILAHNQGVFAQSFNGGATVRQIGNVTSDESNGIEAYASGANAEVTSEGAVQAKVNGITAYVFGSGDATIDHDGNVTANDGYGIVAHVGSDGNATITSRGTIQAQTQGVSAFVNGDGDASVTHVGDVTSDDAFGIRADVNNNGNATVDSKGTVRAQVDGVTAFVRGDGDASVTHEGDVTSEDTTGIQAQVQGTGNAMVDSSGKVVAQQEGIFGRAADGNVEITHVGDIESTNSDGIYAEALGSGHTAMIDSTGDIQSFNTGLFAQSDGNATVESIGDVNSDFSRGIYAYSRNGAASVMSMGDITSFDNGLFAQGETGAIIRSTGDVTSQLAEGILALAEGTGNAEVYSKGKIVAETGRGIVAINAIGSGDVHIESDGDVEAEDTAITAFTSNGSAYVKSVGDVTSSGNQGIQSQTNNDGSAEIDSNGNISSKTVALLALSRDGYAKITQTGDVTSSENSGIQAQAKGVGDASIKSSGKVTSFTHGVIAMSDTGSASVEHDGDIYSEEGVGIQAQTGIGGSGGNASVDSSGFIDAWNEGILAIADNGNVAVTHVGNITSRSTYGVNAIAFDNGYFVHVDVAGNVMSWVDGIQALGLGTDNDVWLRSRGNVTSTSSAGIRAIAQGSGGTVEIDSEGNVTGGTYGLFGLADQEVEITHVGDAMAIGLPESEAAIYAQSDNSTVDVWAGGGSVHGNQNGIFALGAGNVNVTFDTGDVTADVQRGIFAQSSGGDVQVDIIGGRILADGSTGDSDGVFANALAGGAVINVDAGSWITGGSDPSASFAVEFGTSGGTNMLTNYGLLDDANGGKTIGGDASDEIVYNYGMVDGDFYLGGGANRFDNMFGGSTYFKAFSSVGAGNDFNNSGIVSPFGPMMVGSSVLEGNFNQGATGTFLADLDFAGSTSDYLDVTGDVDAGGNVKVYVTSLGTSLTPFSTTIINSLGAVTDSGIAGSNQGALNVEVSTTATTVDIDVAVDFGGFGELSGNQAELGAYFQSLFEQTAPGGLTPDQEAFYLGLINSGGDLEGYQQGLNQLSPEAANAGVIGTMYAATGFANNVFSCPQRDGAYRYIAEGSCVWTMASGRHTSHDGGAGGVDFDDDAATLSGGAQYKVDAIWSVGFGVGYEHGESDVDPSSEFERDLFNLGVVAKGQFDNLLVGAALTGGVGSIDSTRHLTIPVIADAVADRSIAYGSLTARAAYLFDMNSYYVKPMIEGAATYVSADGYTETGAGVANQTVSSTDEFFGRASLSVELGAEYGSADGVLFRPYVAGGVTFLSNSDIDVQAAFPGLGDGSVTLTTDMDTVYADVRAGVNILGGSGWVGRLEYDGRFSSNDQQHTGSAKFSMPF